MTELQRLTDFFIQKETERLNEIKKIIKRDYEFEKAKKTLSEDEQMILLSNYANIVSVTTGFGKEIDDATLELNRLKILNK